MGNWIGKIDWRQILLFSDWSAVTTILRSADALKKKSSKFDVKIFCIFSWNIQTTFHWHCRKVLNLCLCVFKKWKVFCCISVIVHFPSVSVGGNACIKSWKHLILCFQKAKYLPLGRGLWQKNLARGWKNCLKKNVKKSQSPWVPDPPSWCKPLTDALILPETKVFVLNINYFQFLVIDLCQWNTDESFQDFF